MTLKGFSERFRLTNRTFALLGIGFLISTIILISLGDRIDRLEWRIYGAAITLSVITIGHLIFYYKEKKLAE